MSESNGKVCCNCRYNKREKSQRYHDMILCYCEVNNSYLSYATVMTGWCRHWAKADDIMEWFKKWAKEVENETTNKR